MRVLVIVLDFGFRFRDVRNVSLFVRLLFIVCLIIDGCDVNNFVIFFFFILFVLKKVILGLRFCFIFKLSIDGE